MASGDRRARYDGPFVDGVELTNIELADGQLANVHVKRGGLVPLELRGQPITAAFIDRLVEQDDWTETYTGGQKPVSKLTKAELVDRLTGVEIPENANVKELRKLLTENKKGD